MNNVVRWNLLGETVYEELDFENIPEYVKDNFEDTVNAYLEGNEKYGTVVDGKFTVSELVREVFYVTMLKEISSKSDAKEKYIKRALAYKSEPLPAELLCYQLDAEYRDNLNMVDELNGSMMEMFKLKRYQVQKNLNEICAMEEKPENMAVNYSVLWMVDDVLLGNKDVGEFENNSRDQIDQSVQGLLYIIYEWKDEDTADPIRDWLMQGNAKDCASKYELKRRLLRNLLVIFEKIGEAELGDNLPWTRWFYKNGIAKILVDDESFKRCMEACMNILNDSLLYAQQTICNLEVLYDPDFSQNKDVDKIQGILNDTKRFRQYTVTRCFALIKESDSSEGNIYYAISGEDKQGGTAFQNLEQQLKPWKRVKLGNVQDKVRYHFKMSEEKYVTYGECRKLYQSEIGFGRMFSCCERKLLTKTSDNKKYTIYVRLKPCYMCIEELKHIERTNKNKLVQVCFGNDSTDEKDRKWFDTLAEIAYQRLEQGEKKKKNR